MGGGGGGGGGGEGSKNTATGQNNVLYTVPKVIDVPRYNMKCSGENVIHMRNSSRTIRCSSTFHVLSRKFGLLF